MCRILKLQESSPLLSSSGSGGLNRTMLNFLMRYHCMCTTHALCCHCHLAVLSPAVEAPPWPFYCEHHMFNMCCPFLPALRSAVCCVLSLCIWTQYLVNIKASRKGQHMLTVRCPKQDGHLVVTDVIVSRGQSIVCSLCPLDCTKYYMHVAD